MDRPKLEGVWNNQDAARFMAWLQTTQDDYLAVDTETTGLDVWHDTIRMVQFGDRMHGWAIPYETDEGLIDEHAWHLVETALRYCGDTGRPLSAHRMKFDSLFLQNAQHSVDAICQDGKASAHLLDSTCSSLKEAAARAFGPWVLEGEQQLLEVCRKNGWVASNGKRMTELAFSKIPLTEKAYWYYAALDPVLEARLQAHNEPTIVDHYLDLYEMELNVSLALQRAETRGIIVDLDYCQEQYDALSGQMREVEEEWNWINLGSGPQVAEALDAGWGIKLPLGPPSAKKGTQQAKTDERTLRRYRGNELVDVVLHYRDLEKNAETYFGSYLRHAVDGRIHTFIETLGARTGRMSSRNPNLQNVPKRVAGDYVRRAFTATPGCTLIFADYKQIEYRIFASAAGEPDMIEAILNGEDLHAVTARLAFDDPSIDSDDPRRDIAKNGNFSEIYLAGVQKFADTAGISVDAAKAFKQKYHARFKRVKPFSKAVLRYAEENGFAVDTRFGRHIPVDRDVLYAALNYMIQGSAADVLKRAIQKIATTEWDEYFVLPVHDELIFDVPVELAPRLIAALPDLMEDRDTFKVPLEIDISAAYRWGEKEAA